MNLNPLIDDNASAEFPPADHLVEIASGGETLFGTLLVASGEVAKPTVLLLHGFPGSEKHGDLAHVLLRAGYNVLSFSYRGSWGSTGVFRFAHVLADVQAALAFVRENAAAYRVDTERLVLLGHSMGGWAALLTAAADADVAGVISMAGFNFGKFVTDVLEFDDFMISLTKQSWVHEVKPLNATASELVDELVENYAGWDLTTVAAQIGQRPVLLIAAENDDIAANFIHHNPLAAAYETAGTDLTATIFPNDGHGFYASRVRLVKTILQWLAEKNVSGN